jgi:tRNA threonylcarbamoyladenosine biosynthesis protein TsaB
MEYLLHIDTSSDTATVMVSGDGKPVATATTDDNRNYAALINNMVAEVLQKAGTKLAEIKGVVVCAGPGSYTGLRIGMATAKGYCYALNVPLILHNKLDLLAWNACNDKKTAYNFYGAVLYAREREYFAVLYDNNLNAVLQPKHVTEEELMILLAGKDSLYVVSDVPSGIFNQLINNSIELLINNNINVNYWAALGYEDLKCNRIVNLSTAEPFYLKQVYTHK